ncbi:MAG: AAA family ATPase [Bacteroidetes bacterium]|nr:MAG: AAA family ATPase [Bacteroidota bacterium]
MENTIEKGTYEIIQQRLQQQRQNLIEQLQLLNKERQKIFGSLDFKLLSNVRVNTEHHCLARDLVSVANVCLLGYNVRLGLKTVLEIPDVFSVYHFRDNEFHPAPLDVIMDKEFATELQNLYKFFRHTRFSRFVIRQNFLYMIFQLSESPSDIKAFKWIIQADNLVYVDSRSAAEVKFPHQHEFRWSKATRDMQRIGKNPHVSIADKVFVETVHGDLTIKVEDNTEDGLGIYREDVEQKDQSLDDGEIHFCDLGNIVLLKIKPYLESERFFIFNHRLKNVVRVDTLRDAGILLPDDQGIILSNGYYLQTGEYKIFDRHIEGVKFLRRVQSPNGEDHLFVFYEEQNHDFVILSYNVIEQTVKTPIFCNGYTLFEEGELCYFNAETEPGRHHLIQVWQTPYTQELIANDQFRDHDLYKIGNKAIVAAMAEIQELIVLLNKEDSYQGLYQDIAKKGQSILDAYFWLKNGTETGLQKPLKQTREVAMSAIDEYEKVLQIRKNTAEALQKVSDKVEKILFDTRSASFETLDEYVTLLAEMRAVRGEIIGLRNLRYIKMEVVSSMEEKIADRAEVIADSCVQFLLKDNALAWYQENMDRLEGEVDTLKRVVDARSLEKQFDELAHKLELLIDIINNLKVEDTTHSTKIIENISLIFSRLNQQRQALNNKRRQLGEKEARADFHAQMTLFEQSVVNFMELATDPAKCDDFLTKLSIQLEELEGKYVDFDEFTEKISEKREAVYSAFESKKVSLTEARNRRTNALYNSAERVLKAIASKVQSYSTEAEINGHFASDLMVEKVRDTADELEKLEDSAKSEDLRNRLQVMQQEAIRALKDKKELFEEGENIIKLGESRFAVNTQPLDLTLVIRNKQYYYHLTGTSFYEPVDSSSIQDLHDVWDQLLPSENREVARAEYLAWKVFLTLDTTKVWEQEELVRSIQQYMAANYGEGFIKGVHDADALQILQQLTEKQRDLGMLRFPASTRSLAKLYWHYAEEEQKEYFKKQFVFINLMQEVFEQRESHQHLLESLASAMGEFAQHNQLFTHIDPHQAATYLAREQATSGFVLDKGASELLNGFKKHLKSKNADITFTEAQKELRPHPAALWHLTRRWVTTFLQATGKTAKKYRIDEVTSCLLPGFNEPHYILHLSGTQKISNMRSVFNDQEGEKKEYSFDYHRFTEKLIHFCGKIQPRYLQLQQLKHKLVTDKKNSMRLHELNTQVLTSFVRNKLINQVYLPLIGANFARQIGAYGQDKRTDRSGMLLLISPPGYGKTTLMEYVADRLGLIFMKINAPSLGHEITSVDPAEARNAAARQELQKLNLAFEMGDNVMLYLDDIQHCNAEFLQKFISLADAQRRMDGVYNGQAKTWDFRGKRFCVVMAGNPYTESGDKFQIPDMLSNRADIYNLGDMTYNRQDLFNLSLIENGITSNPFLKSLTRFSMENLYRLVQFLENEDTALPDLEGNLSTQEIQDCVQVLRKCLRVRDVVLKVNSQYIASAAMADDYRTEPHFKLQGSYRDMNKLMSQVVPILNDDEVLQLLLGHYQNESQTLTTGAEANLLKLFELIGLLDEQKQERWNSIKETFVRNNRIRGLGDQDRMAQVIGQMTLFVDGLEGIRKALGEGKKG